MVSQIPINLWVQEPFPHVTHGAISEFRLIGLSFSQLPQVRSRIHQLIHHPLKPLIWPILSDPFSSQHHTPGPTTRHPGPRTPKLLKAHPAPSGLRGPRSAPRPAGGGDRVSSCDWYGR